MANDLKNPQTLAPSEITRIFSGMSPLKATRYYNKCMTNPNTPNANLALLRQYREQNSDRFLSDEQMKGQRSKGSWNAGRGFGGGYRNRNNGRIYDSYGDSYDNSGKRYDRYGNEYRGYRDGGREPDYSGYEDKGFSDNYGPYDNNGYGGRKYGRSKDYGGRRYDDNGNNYGSGRRSVWSSFWKPKDEFDKMPKNKQRFYAGAFNRKNRMKNTAYGLRVITDPDSKTEDRRAMVEVVRENPFMFFTRAKPNRAQHYVSEDEN